jgi:hypothetical protein
MRCFLLLSTIAWFLFFGGLCGAGDQVFFQNEDLVISGEGHLGYEAKYLSQIYPGAKREIEGSLGFKLLSKPTVWLIGNRAVFVKLSGSSYVSAFAVPSEHLIAIHISSMTSRLPVLDDTFKHELCHLILHDHIDQQVLPKWLDEGVCQWISGTLGETLAGGGATISRIDMVRRLIPLSQLAAAFPSDENSLYLAYRESRDFVEYLTAHYGSEGLRGILKRLEEGDSIGPAISKSLSRSFQDVQEEWIDDMQKRSEWLVWATQNLYEIIFFIMAVLSILAYVRLRMRRRAYTGSDQDDDQAGNGTGL